MLRTISLEYRYRWFLTGIALLGFALVLIATSRYGAGVSSDAARNLSTADNLIAGRGFVDMVGGPFVLWPPLYPLVLAGFSALTSLDTFHVAWYLNGLLLGTNLWLAGWMLFSVFRQTPVFAIAGSLLLLFSRSLLRIHANVASEPLFATFMLASFLAAGHYLNTGSRRSLWIMCLAAGLASLQRYLGISLLFMAAIVIWRRGGWRTVWNGPIQLVLAAAPLVAWAFLHNLPISGAPFGPRELGAMLPLQNMSLALTKMLWWFIPRWGPLDWLILRPLLPLVFTLLLLIAVNARRDWLAWLSALSDNLVWPALLFGIVYFLLLAFTVVTADHLDLTSDRYYVILLPVAVVLIFITLDKLVLSHLGDRRRYGLAVVAGILAIWSAYPLYSVQSYLRLAVKQGEPTNYNIANSAHFREMSVVRAAEGLLAADPNAIVYSNYVNIVWFIFHHPVQVLPFQDESLPREARLASLTRSYPGWPDMPGYIIWFIPNEYHHIVAPADLQTIADLTLLFEDETGQVFFVRPRSK